MALERPAHAEETGVAPPADRGAISATLLASRSSLDNTLGEGEGRARTLTARRAHRIDLRPAARRALAGLPREPQERIRQATMLSPRPLGRRER